MKKMINPIGRPTKPKSVTPGLRVDAKTWAAFTAKYPRMANKMFNEWVKSLL